MSHYEQLINEELEHLPEKLRGPVYSLAYEYGHSSGKPEVLNYVMDIVAAIAEPIQKEIQAAEVRGYQSLARKF